MLTVMIESLTVLKDASSAAIYGCEHIDLETQGWGYYTQKADKLYLIVFNKPVSNKLKVVFPKKTLTPVKAYLLQDKADTPFVITIDIKDNANDKDIYQQAHT